MKKIIDKYLRFVDWSNNLGDYAFMLFIAGCSVSGCVLGAVYTILERIYYAS